MATTAYVDSGGGFTWVPLDTGVEGCTLAYTKIGGVTYLKGEYPQTSVGIVTIMDTLPAGFRSLETHVRDLFWYNGSDSSSGVVPLTITSSGVMYFQIGGAGAKVARFHGICFVAEQ